LSQSNLNIDISSINVRQRYLRYSLLIGSLAGVLGFAEVIARKSLGASELSVTLISMTWPVTSLISIWWARLLVGRDQRKFVWLFGTIAYLVLASGGFLNSVGHLMAILILFFLINSLFIPSENRILQQHFPATRTGRIFGLASGMRTGTAALASLFAGLYMDRVEGGYRHLFVIVSIIGFIALTQFASIKTGHVKGADAVPLNRRMLFEPLKKVIQLLSRRRDFLRFEAAFMLYGVAFMMTLPVIPLYLVDDLKFGYTTIGLARGMVTQLVMIVAVPLLGRVFDRSTPHRMAAIIFLALSIFPFLLLSAGQFEGTMRLIMVYISFGYFGLVMSGVLLLWGLSSLRFAGEEDAGVYHSVHVAAVGVRGIFAPLLGYLVMTTMGKTVTLITCSVLWVLSSIMMILMRKIDLRSGDYRSLRAE